MVGDCNWRYFTFNSFACKIIFVSFSIDFFPTFRSLAVRIHKELNTYVFFSIETGVSLAAILFLSCRHIIWLFFILALLFYTRVTFKTFVFARFTRNTEKKNDGKILFIFRWHGKNVLCVCALRQLANGVCWIWQNVMEFLSVAIQQK